MKKRLEISSKLDNLREVEKFIDEISENIGLHSDVYGKVLLSTIEAANNSIIHGNKLNANKKVIVEAYIEEENLRIIISDEGEGFDYYNIPDPTRPENIENIHGRGIFLIKNLSDELVFTDEGRSVEIVFKY